MGIGPDVRAVIVHENGDVTGNANRVLVTVCAQTLPLVEEGKLNDAPDIEFLFELFHHQLEARGFAAGQLSRPLIPALLLLMFAQAVEEYEILEPPMVVTAELFKTRALGRRSTGPELPRGSCEQRQFSGAHFVIVDGGSLIR